MDETELPQATRAALARAPQRRDWDAFAAVIAALIGLLALCVSAYTAYLQRQQVRAQVWPYLESGISSSRRTVSLANKGVGPALIRSVHVRVDGKPQRNWKAVFQALGLDFSEHVPYSTINGIVISANDHVDQLTFPSSEYFNAFVNQAQRVELSVCYCSSLGECWTYSDAAMTLPIDAHKPVAQCDARASDQFFDNESADPAQPDRTRPDRNQPDRNQPDRNQQDRTQQEKKP